MLKKVEKKPEHYIKIKKKERGKDVFLKTYFPSLLALESETTWKNLFLFFIFLYFLLNIIISFLSMYDCFIPFLPIR